ncbi:MAG: riboflavin synthase [Firmicutes bacterium]|nr:riboflavin synthase [Bacillota bacterium]
MFTGIIEETGTVDKVGSRMRINAKKVTEDVNIGDSISVNGVCLTVTAFTNDGFCADVMPETLRCSNLGSLKKGSVVNLERAMPANGRFGGHIVSGHIDGTGVITDIKNDGNAVKYTISADKSVLRYIIYKGSVAVDGISLTVCAVDDKSFCVSVIPHTMQQTDLVQKKCGDTVNIETDIIAGYIEKLIKESGKSTIDEDFLRRCGF